jgi:hypothetical protein
MRRFAVATLILIGIAVLLCIAPVIASDCGCGGLPDSGPPDGWDTPGSFSGGGGSGGTGGGGSDTGADPGNSGDTSGADTGGSNTGSDSYSSAGGDSDYSSGGSTTVQGSGATDDAALLVSKARTALQQGNYEESLQAFDTALSEDNNLMAAWMGKAQAETLLGNYTDAVASYNRAARLDPGDADPWVGKGTAYLAAGDYTKAIESFDRALVIHPGLADALEGRALADRLNTTMETASAEVTGEVPTDPAGDGQFLDRVPEVTAPADIPGNNDAPAEVLAVSVPGSAPSMLPMLAAIMAFAVIMYRRKTN